MNLEGIQLGGYLLLSLLGKGGMAEVWLAEQIVLNRKVAVKVILEAPEENDIKQQVARFSREAQTLAQLDHLNILPIIDYGSARGYLYLVTPYVSGGSLLEQLRQNWISGTQALDMCDSILAGLSYAHQKGIIHRDLKPGNILLRDSNRPVIGDFGVAKIENDNLNLTQQGVVLGSPEYMAPEQFLGHSYYSSDLYALSVLLYQMFSGQVPYRGTTATEIGMRHLNDQIPLPNPQIPEPLAQILHKGLQKNPENRFATADSMRAALSEAKKLLTPQQLQSMPSQHQIQQRVSAFPTKIIQTKLTLEQEPVFPATDNSGHPPQSLESTTAPVSSLPYKPSKLPLPKKTSLNPASTTTTPGSSKQSESEAATGLPENSNLLQNPVPLRPEKGQITELKDMRSTQHLRLKPKLRVPELPDETSSENLPVVISKKTKVRSRPRQGLPLKLILGLVGLLVISVLVAVGSVLFANKALPQILQPVSFSPAASVLANGATPGPVTITSTTGTGVTNNSPGNNITPTGASTAPLIPIVAPSSVPTTSNLNSTTPGAPSPKPLTTTIAITPSPPVATSPATTSQTSTNVQVPMLAVNGTAARGSATLTAKGDGTFTVVVDMIGLGQGDHPSHIHNGTCQEEGSIQFELNSIMAGLDGTASATTVIKGDLATLRSGHFYVDVANVSGDFFYVASCGDIKF